MVTESLNDDGPECPQMVNNAIDVHLPRLPSHLVSSSPLNPEMHTSDPHDLPCPMIRHEVERATRRTWGMGEMCTRSERRSGCAS
jgi:hypothetical protein